MIDLWFLALLIIVGGLSGVIGYYLEQYLKKKREEKEDKV